MLVQDPRMSTSTVREAEARWPTLSETTLCAAFQHTVASIPERTALRTPGGGVEISWREYGERVRRIAGGLAASGVGAGDVVALMLTNRPEHCLVDTAAMHLGATPFSVYATCPVDEVAWLLDTSEARVVFTEPAFAERVLAAADRTPGVREVVLVEGDAAGARALAELESTAPPAGFDFDASWRSVAADSPITLIFTSGTTGEPKGVQHTHSSIMYMLRSLNQVSPVSPGGRVVSFLPMAHIAERYISHYSAMVFGYSITTVGDLKTLASVLPEVRPTRMFAVPRVYEKLHAALEGAIATEADPVKQREMRDAIDTGLRKVRAEQAGQAVADELLEAYAAADERVLTGLRARIGFDQLEWPSVGAAPSPYSMLEFFHAIGVPIQELWGMSETLLVTINPPQRVKLGTVGPAMPGVGLKLAPDGEVLISGGSLMLGYKDSDDLTAAAIVDGWMHTGDIGELDGDGYLRIIDRKKELIINSAGKNMAPSKIEGELQQGSPLIGRAICIGDRRLYNVALITLDPDTAAAWAAEHGVGGAPITALAADDRLRAAVADGVAAANARLARVEQIKAFRLLDHEWLPGSDELTPTMKLKRKRIEQRYAAEIEALYANSER
jgi:long-subunit acyl-CoA synthetase (AMP-forming)